MTASSRQAVWAAAGTAALAIAFQTAGKATRDAIFLSAFPVTALPAMTVAAAGASVVLALGSAWALTRYGPRWLVPIGFAASAVLLLVEWWVLQRVGRLAAVLVYLHYAAFGAVLVSGLWSIVSERFDPRAARRQISRIGAAGTLGGVVGGLVAARAGAVLTVPAMLPILAAVHVAAAFMAGVTARGLTRSGGLDEAEAVPTRVAERLPYLKILLVLVLLTTLGETMLDYVFKVRVTGAVGRGEDLLRFFAWFYTATGLLAFAVQAGVSRRALRRLGLARSVGALPMAAAAGAGGALVVGGLPAVVVARAVESVSRYSLFRSGYELLFAPLLPAEKRASKAVLDVGAARVGDIAGALVIQATLLAAAATTVLLGLTVVVSVLAAVLAFRLQRQYVSVLRQSLAARSSQIDDLTIEADALQSAMLHTVGLVDVTVTAERERAAPWAGTPVEAGAGAPETGPASTVEDRRAVLQSRDAARVRRALGEAPLTPDLVAAAIRLLAWDAVAAAASDALQVVAADNVDPLLRALLDPDEEFTVRRRVPLVCAVVPTQAVADGLAAGLADARFEVRYRCGLALHRLLRDNASLQIDRQRIEEAVLREVSVDRRVWESHRVLEQQDDEAWSPVFDEVLRTRASRALQHVFTMLAFVLDPEPLQLAYRGLHARDPHVRGTALEYLETALPPDVRRALWPFLEDSTRRQPARRSRDEIIDDLKRSAATIALDLERHRRPSSG